MPTAPPRGVRKSSELIVQKGRTLIFTEEEANEILWSDIPNGSLKINPETGLMSVKLKGESNWVPAGIKNDGTISIARDTRLVTEVYTIINPDEGDGHFSCENEAGETRHFPLTDDGYPVFYLEKGSYQMLRNQVTVTIDDCLHRSVASGGVIELSETRIQLNEQLKAGQEITIMYSNVVRIGNPYPRIFINDNEPDVAEVGDFWLDTDSTLAEDDYLGENVETNKTIDWSRITHKPTNTDEYGIKNEIKEMIEDHRVDITMIDNFPSFPSTINATTIQGHDIGTSPNNVFLIPSDGKIPSNLLPSNVSTKDEVPDIRIGSTTPTSPQNNKTVWFCTAANNTCVKVYTNNRWISLGAVWS